MHDKLWAGVELKLENARFHFEKMWQSLEWHERTHMDIALESAGAIRDRRWQRSFYAWFDDLCPDKIAAVSSFGNSED